MLESNDYLPEHKQNGANGKRKENGRKSPQGGRLSRFYRNVNNFLDLDGFTD